MTKIEEERFRKALEDKQQEIKQTLRKRDGILVERSADTVDEVRQASETELRIWNLEQESALLRSIRDPCRTSKKADSEPALTVEMRSLPDGSPPCLGPHCAFIARRCIAGALLNSIPSNEPVEARKTPSRSRLVTLFRLSLRSLELRRLAQAACAKSRKFRLGAYPEFAVGGGHAGTPARSASET